MLGVVLAAGAIFAVGLIDDVRDMSAPAKVAGQVLAASILYFMGVTMTSSRCRWPGFIVLTPGMIPLITALWVIALTNAVNLIDGLDGLAAGVVAIGGGALAIYGLRLMGLGILPTRQHRARWSPWSPAASASASSRSTSTRPGIFMGDAGALLLGLLMAASTMVIGGRVPTAAPISGVTYFFFAPLFIPFFILGVPIVDMAFAFVRRTAKGTGFRHPGQEAHPPPAAPAGPRPPAERASSCGPGRPSCPASSSSPCSCTRSTPSSRSGRPPWASASTRCSTRGCAGGTGTDEEDGQAELASAPSWGAPAGQRGGPVPCLRNRLDAIRARMR